MELYKYMYLESAYLPRMLDSLREDINAFSNWANNARENVNQYGLRGGTMSLVELFSKGTFTIIGKYLYNYGVPVFERDWDILIVLDACRFDLFEEALNDHSFLPNAIESTASVGSHTSEWMEKNFQSEYKKEMARTAYITGNPQSQHYIDKDEWLAFYDPWRIHRDKIGTIPPETITEYGIDAYRRLEPERMILHYMQPHQPFRSFDAVEESHNWISKDVWDRLQSGEYDSETIWKAYSDNLRWVLEDISRIFDNVDAKSVVITSDHGNALGEYGVYGHPRYVPIPSIKRVPWVELSAENIEELDPQYTLEKIESEVKSDFDVKDRLADLGYV